MNSTNIKRNSKDRLLLSEMKKRKSVCENKLNKINNRIKILEAYEKQASGTNITLKQFLKSKGLVFEDFFTPMGYYTGANKVVSSDVENNFLEFSNGMYYDEEIGFPIPHRETVSSFDQSELEISEYGMILNPSSNRFEPKDVYDSETFSRADGSGDLGMDIMGGLKTEDLAVINRYSNKDKNFFDFVKELYLEEYDNVEDELDLIDGSIDKLRSNYSSAEGDKEDTRKTESGKNLRCRTTCNAKHPFNPTKRNKCKEDCDKKFKPSGKQEERREQREGRKSARKEFRADRRNCKKEFQSGKLTHKQYRACIKTERKERREQMEEAGGSLFAKAVRNTRRYLNPLTALARGGVLTLTDWNAFGFATRLAPAILPENEAKEKFTPEAIEKAKKGWKKVSYAYLNLGGKPEKLRQKVIKGYLKKPYKVRGKENLGFNGEIQYTYSFDGDGIHNEVYSNDGGSITIASTVVAGISALAGLIGALNKSGAKKNPYKEGYAPQDYTQAVKEGVIDDVPEQEEGKPFLDPNTGEWIDLRTGKKVDPVTGKYKDDIFGLNKWLVIGLGVATLAGIYLLAKKK